MGEILGVGLSHYPLLSGKDENMDAILRYTLDDPDIDPALKDPANWPESARTEWSDPTAAAGLHRRAMVAATDRVRAAIDDFAPDVVVIWGDDQYENFHEDVVPAFCVLAYDDLSVQPWAQVAESGMLGGKPNAWDEPGDFTMDIKGRPDVAKYLASGLLERGIDTAYAYTQHHHHGLPHAFLNAILYLDYHRAGWPYPTIPFPINCYGRRVLSYRGFWSRIGDKRELDPPSPPPWRLMQMGAAAARVMAESPWRVAFVASSSWSHAFLCDKTSRLFPDTEADLRLYEAMTSGDFETWRSWPLSQVESSGQQEILNWWALLGAMEELGHKVTFSEFVETHVFNSNKVFAIYQPG